MPATLLLFLSRDGNPQEFFQVSALLLPGVLFSIPRYAKNRNLISKKQEAEQYILDNNSNLKTSVLKIGHHGSDSSTGYVWLRETMPEYAIISVGSDNSYGHPTEAVLSRLRDTDIKKLRAIALSFLVSIIIFRELR